MRCIEIAMERVATFSLKKWNFAAKLQPEIIIVIDYVFLYYSRRFSENHQPTKFIRIFGCQNTGFSPAF
jgi:hypothetical protein